ncbi:hypothetical protein BKA66DRAFT_479573 [Pyrenochaeta sp. MPI-SDFR-AT-0127]|nr:hypothetical protein BKA66DRAFT_479573 [Pyrenochaeta sp. MPI-SDFR-AT-0127]
MTMAIKNVALAGATGNAGAPILNSLLVSNLFNVTVLTRPGSKHTFPPAVTVKPVDYASLASLTAALEGQDVLINTTSIEHVEQHVALIDAALAARVARYFPSDFGLDTYKPAIAALPIFEGPAAALKYMHEKCTAPGSPTTYTVVHNGGFLDWCFETAFLGVDPREKQATIFDEGTNEIAYTTQEWVGKAVVAILCKLEETKNRSVFVANTYVSQKKLLELSKEVVGADGWTVGAKSTDQMLAKSMEALENGTIDLEGILDFIRVADAKYETKWETDDNELLGIPRFSDEDIKEVIRKVVS